MLRTEEAVTVGKGRFRTEAEFGITKQPDASELYNIPRLRVEYGLSEWADVEFEFEYLAVRDTDFITHGDASSKTGYNDEGIGDLRIKLKVVPYDFGAHRLGFQAITKLPNANQETGLGTNETDFTCQALLSSDWGAFTTHLNAGFAVVGDPFTNRNQNDYFILGAGAEYALKRSLILMGEIEGSTAGDKSTDTFAENIAECSEGNDRVRARMALTGPVGTWRWGFSAFKGLNSHTEDWGVQFGLSKTWDIGADALYPGVHPAAATVEPESYYNPLKTVEASTIPERQFRTEVAFRYANQPDDSDLYIIPDVALGWGIGPWADLELEFQYLRVEDTFTRRTDKSVYDEDVNTSGIGDVRIKIKLAPFEWNDAQLGVQFTTKVPSADDEGALGTDETDFIAAALLSVDWSEFSEESIISNLKTHFNAGIAVQGDPYNSGRQDDLFVWGVAAEYGLPAALTVWAELEGSTNGRTVHNISEGDYGNNYMEARAALSGPMPDIPLLRGWLWSMNASAGLNNYSRDWTAGIGFSRTWGL
jgi:opacity protein-like surface antigen